MKIVLSKLPESGWWKSGLPQYKDNPAMKKGQIPINNLLIKERGALIKAIQEEGHEIVELDFPKKLDGFLKFNTDCLRFLTTKSSNELEEVTPQINKDN